MKHVVLFGDSIRLGYRATVAHELKGVADVWSPDDNCENSLKILTYWRSWLEGKNPDVLHLNCGLHDVKTISGETSEMLVPLEWYWRNLERLFENLRQMRPQTKLIFATTTPVLEHVTRAPGRAFCRSNAAIDACNDAARELAERFGVEINDLNALVKKRGPETMINPDGVHFGDEASRILGEAVAQKIRAWL